MRRLLLPLLLAGLGLGLGEPDPPAPSGVQCLEHDCFAVFWAPASFAAANAACERHGGHLMTVRSTVAEEAIQLLLRDRGGWLWLGLRLPTPCTEPARRLRGFQWVTGDTRTDYDNWATTRRRCGQFCVAVSRELSWEERHCEQRADGFLCEYNYPDSCPRLLLAGGVSVTYRTPFGGAAGDFLALPPGSTAFVSPLGLQLLCGTAAAGGGMRWGRSAPGAWPCRVANGGCEESCEELDGAPRCSCPAGKKLGPDGRDCVSPCADAPCQHHCVPDGEGFHCMCAEGYRLGPDDSSCEDVDDCVKVPEVCEQVCHNTEGGFECRCHRGYEMVEGRCVPVPDCSTGPCDQICEDVAGSYRCSCDDGYVVDPKNPTQCVRQCENGRCLAECTSGGLSCFCPDGFVTDQLPDGVTFCIDIDECEHNYCDHNCTNTYGSYVCYCQPGYVAVDANHCQPSLPEDGMDEYSGDFGPPLPVPSHIPPKAEHLHPGALVGITVGVLCLALVLVAVGYHVARKRCHPPSSMEYKCGSPREKEMGLQQVPASQKA
ncbi:thrombomodulin [Numida meleagris]|uniref:thrombomodulin n=1 Tax=Numida meleagris TaxID=8996 RepID=UPI000B3DAB55|nr:thrombomodulin [Numida meleagris]